MTAFVIKMMYKTELAHAYGVSLKHLNSMLAVTRVELKKVHKKDVLGDYTGRRLLTIAQVKYIVEHNGLPYD